jgi:hypothetical protein
MYGVWIDGKRIDNKELAKYNPSDFAFYYNSKLTKTAINYGKHYYQIDLYTRKYYEKSFGEPLMVINGNPLPGLKTGGP